MHYAKGKAAFSTYWPASLINFFHSVFYSILKGEGDACFVYITQLSFIFFSCLDITYTLLLYARTVTMLGSLTVIIILLRYPAILNAVNYKLMGLIRLL
jgi:hypothetical protein